MHSAVAFGHILVSVEASGKLRHLVKCVAHHTGSSATLDLEHTAASSAYSTSRVFRGPSRPLARLRHLVKCAENAVYMFISRSPRGVLLDSSIMVAAPQCKVSPCISFLSSLGRRTFASFIFLCSVFTAFDSLSSSGDSPDFLFRLSAHLRGHPLH